MGDDADDVDDGVVFQVSVRPRSYISTKLCFAHIMTKTTPRHAEAVHVVSAGTCAKQGKLVFLFSTRSRSAGQRCWRRR